MIEYFRVYVPTNAVTLILSFDLEMYYPRGVQQFSEFACRKKGSNMKGAAVMVVV